MKGSRLKPSRPRLMWGLVTVLAATAIGLLVVAAAAIGTWIAFVVIGVIIAALIVIMRVDGPRPPCC